MIATLVYLLVVLLVLIAIELIYFKIADRCNILDKPNERSSHSSNTIRGGGIIFYFGVLIYFFVSGFQYPCFLLGLTMISLISFMDDLKPVSQAIRLVIHFIAMLLLLYQCDTLSYPWWYMLVGLIVCTGIINAYNFMDGINGITGGYSLVVLLLLAYINRHLSFVDPNLIVIMLLAVLVFSFFNFRTKAKCFAGDVGSMSIAFILVFLIGKLILKTQDISYLMLLSVYGVDSVLTIIHRIILKEKIGLPHRKHLYQILSNELKVPHLVTSLSYMGLQALVMVGYFLCFEYRYIYSGIVLLLLCLGYYLFMKKYFHLHLARNVSD